MVKFFKKVVLYAILIFVIMFGYQYMTGENIVALPGKIVHKLEQRDTATESKNPHYISNPAKRIPKELQ